jgi:chemotaxis protein CheD
MSTGVMTDIFLHPGEWYFGGQGTKIRTLLGSCVSITLWHPRHKVGGMCHYLLAERSKYQNVPLSGRYANEAMLLLLQDILHSGLAVKEFQAKLFGGAAVLPNIERDLPAHDVPGRNIEVARNLTRQLGISIQAEDLGGNHARMVQFDIDSGDVWVRQATDAHLGDSDKKGLKA